MTMHVHKLVTHLSATDALSVIDLLDQLREVLIASYAEQIDEMLQEVQTINPVKPDENAQPNPIIPFDEDPF